jgi:hypothetical protein
MEETMDEVMSTLEVRSIKHETPKAWLAILEDDKEVWFPKSQCKMDGNTLSVPGWLLKEKGLNEWD